MKLPLEPGVEQLKSELAAMQFRLEIAEQVKEPLSKLLVPINEVQNELNLESRRLASANYDKKCLESVCHGLANQVAELESALVDMRAGIEFRRGQAITDAEIRRQQGCLGLEHECQALGVQNDGMKGELQEAQFREQELTTKSIQLRIACTETENAALEAESVAQQYFFRNETLERELARSEKERNQLCIELCEERSESGVAQNSLNRALGKLEMLSKEHADQFKTLHDTAYRFGELQSRNDHLEADLKAATTKQIDLASKTMLPGAQHVPFCQSSIGLVPPTSKGSQRELEPQHSPVNSRSSPLCSPNGRRNYPHSAHSRHQRNKVLGLHSNAGNNSVSSTNVQGRWHKACKRCW